jgi:hypothetical protein
MILSPLRAPALLLGCLLLALPGAARAQATVSGVELPRFVEQHGHHALIVDGAPFLILGGQCGNSSAWPSQLPSVWAAAERMHLNTLEAPVYWEEFEPEPGRFDPTLVDTLIQQARGHNVRLILLWFGTWKNGSSHYEPLWMKGQPQIYPKIIGKTGLAVDSPSPNFPATLEADSRAFRMLMRHLKAVDPFRTVIMVQVENESGAWDTIRDYSPAAQALFSQPVPAELTTALGLQARAGGNWSAVFGTDADEYFQAWSVARFVGQVAAAGKAEYPLPLYTNCALRDPLTPGPAGTYESGGPTDNVLAIWKAAAPALDVLSPDIYQPDAERYRKVLDLYARPDNPLFVPETGGPAWTAHMVFAALGKGAVGWAPFGIDHVPAAFAAAEGLKPEDDRFAPVGQNYRIIAPIMRIAARLGSEGRLQAVAEDKEIHVQTLHFGVWDAVVSYGIVRFGSAGGPKGNPEPTGGAIVGLLGPDEFLVTARSARVDFKLADPAARGKREFRRVEEGTFENGDFRRLRIWNGDETDYGLNFGTAPVALRVRLSSY